MGVIKLKTEPLAGKELTGQKMYATVDANYADIGGGMKMPFQAWYDYVRQIPYISDSERFQDRLLEVVPRPAYCMDRKLFPKIDCKKKSILIGSWAKGNGVPFRFVAVSDRPDGEATHVFPQLDFGDGWVNADATLPEYFIGRGQGSTVTSATELGR